MADEDGLAVLSAYPQAYRVLVLTVNYTVERTESSSIINPTAGRFAVAESVSGYATFCNPDIYGRNPYVWPLADAAQAYAYQHVSQRLQPVQVAENYVGPDALLLHRPIVTQPNTDNRTIVRYWGTVSPGVNERYWFPSVYAFLPDGTQPFDPWACTAEQTATRTSFGLRVTDTRRVRFAQSAAGGAYQLNTTRTQTVLSDPQQVDTQELSVVVGWNVRLLTCTTGGDTGQLVQPEAGCGNCGDASMLEPLL